MAYNLTLTNGTPLVTLADGTVDTTTVSVNLIGKNYAGYGTYMNQNFIKLLENYSYGTAPVAPLTGQLWYDSTNQVIKVWKATQWKAIASSVSSATAPSSPVTGDTWWDTTASLLKTWSGSSWISIGPAIPPGATVTQFVNNILIDTGATAHSTGNIVVNNQLSAIFSVDATPFSISTPISGISTINPGINLVKGITTVGNAVIGGVVSATGAVSTASTISATGAITSSSSITATGAVNSFSSITGASIISNASITAGTTISATGAISSASTISATGAMSTGNTFTATGQITAGAGIISTGNVVPSANLSYNLGSTTAWWNTVYGVSIQAKYADLAERFKSDQPLSAGTVVEIGGPNEITAVVNDLSEAVLGVISTSPAYLMNSSAGSDDTHPAVAVQGRVPVRVIGTIRKGDRLVSAGAGLARSGNKNEITPWNVIGRALQDKLDAGQGTIEAVVTINS